MADYIAHFRTNAFWTKDPVAFIDWVATIPGLEAHRKDPERDDSAFTLYCDGSEPQFTEDDVMIDLSVELAKHLADNEVAILIETGHEKLRYLVGTAQAVHADGRTIALSLCDIYRMAENAFGVSPTRAEY